eukprot:895587-Amphidinium_carterae.1
MAEVQTQQKRQTKGTNHLTEPPDASNAGKGSTFRCVLHMSTWSRRHCLTQELHCLLYTSDAADDTPC